MKSTWPIACNEFSAAGVARVVSQRHRSLKKCVVFELPTLVMDFHTCSRGCVDLWFKGALWANSASDRRDGRRHRRVRFRSRPLCRSVIRNLLVLGFPGKRRHGAQPFSAMWRPSGGQHVVAPILWATWCIYSALCSNIGRGLAARQGRRAKIIRRIRSACMTLLRLARPICHGRPLLGQLTPDADGREPVM